MFSFDTRQPVIINDRYPAQVIDCPPPRHFTPGIISRMYLIKDVDNICISGREHDVNEIIKIIEQNIKSIVWDDEYDYFDAIINGTGQTTKLTHPKIVKKIYGKTSACITDIGDSLNDVSITGKEYVVDKIFYLLSISEFKPKEKDDSDFFNAFLNAKPSVKSTVTTTNITPKKIYSGSGTTIFLKKDDKYYLVLIKELKTDLWQAFGGKIDKYKDGKEIEIFKNAKKETQEESRLVFDIKIKDSSISSVDVKTPQNDLYKNYIIVIKYLDFEKIKKMFVENIVSYILADERRKKDNESYYETSAINFVDYKNLQNMITENKNKCVSLDGNIVIGNRTIEVMKEIFKQHPDISKIPINNYKSHHNKDRKSVV